MWKLCAGDKGAPGYSGLAGEDGDKVSAVTIFYEIIIYHIFDYTTKIHYYHTFVIDM